MERVHSDLILRTCILRSLGHSQANYEAEDKTDKKAVVDELTEALRAVLGRITIRFRVVYTILCYSKQWNNQIATKEAKVTVDFMETLWEETWHVYFFVCVVAEND